ncbi:hypothetical protein [Burkholderia cenocepacia]|uniref:hypothetical protein n=1 Tax=Burkholderia cenocepacia TaxID=95486 RepID=UPI002876A813|nr:hypothetical protein [Burkholderia cenocepacia]MDS0848492.1 hypothetical protein [Burkholderia cenocepacia]
MGKRNTKPAARYVAAILPPCGSLYQVLKCSGVRRSYAAAGRVAIARLRAPFGTTLAIRESGVPAYFVALPNSFNVSQTAGRDKFIQLLRVCYECLKNTKFMALTTMRWNITSLMVAIQVRRALQC